MSKFWRKRREGKNGYERLAVHKVYYSLGTSNVERYHSAGRRHRLTMWPKAKMRRQTIKVTRFCGRQNLRYGRAAGSGGNYDAILGLNCDRRSSLKPSNTNKPK
jgi:hypothetical protein